MMGSTKMLQVALGKTEADEYRTNLHLMSERTRGPVGLFFTSLPRQEVRTASKGEHGAARYTHATGELPLCCR